MDRDVYQRMIGHQSSHWWFTARRHLLAKVISTEISQSECAAIKPLELLEIGCGPGGNLAMLAEYGQVTATEMDPQALAHARQLMPSLNLLQGSLPNDHNLQGQQFDLVCLFDVLEHIQQDAEALEAVFALTKPGGLVMLTVPAYQWLFSEHDRAHHHFRRYTAGALSRLAQRKGFVVDKVGYFNTFLFPVIAARRVLARLTGQSAAQDDRMPAAWLNRLLHRIFAAEAPIVAKHPFPFGVSVVAILKRP
ncbi:Methyltransferase domain-containing protein [Ectothiorhodospira mobilis]|uniref:Methyltransferase domain-containing protein n=1 Tax=Ectothiorhodospira mobilis TaxID=195064 RepID=A0A1I4SX97_ECTMO|nr:class I SAM-dependent methyltransferase [Ectothiorhodospira mobilis]SFM69086.1 Methyltransferase domain-containing protein [Ectothiorhodospira mobilis]